MNDWGNEIFHDIHQSLHGSTDSPTTGMPPPPGQAPHPRGGARPHEYFPPPGESSNTRYTHHASSLSDSSSIYSSANAGQRHLSRPLSPELNSSSATPTSTVPSSAGSEGDQGHEPSTMLVENPPRGSISSSHHPGMSGDTTDSGGHSHRNTRELGDFYDSYWRQSTQGSAMTGRASGYFSSRGTVESGKDNKRPGQIDFKVTTIAEVDTPLASPMPGTAI